MSKAVLYRLALLAGAGLVLPACPQLLSDEFELAADAVDKISTGGTGVAPDGVQSAGGFGNADTSNVAGTSTGRAAGGGDAGGGGTFGVDSCRDACTCRTYEARAYMFCSPANDVARAQELCESVGQTLANIRDAALNDWLSSTALELGISDAWTAGSDAFQEGTWTWGDGTPVGASGLSSPEFSAWEPGQPDSLTLDDDCLTLTAETQTWWDRECAIEQSFICETSLSGGGGGRPMGGGGR